jgi:hypothetical protein
MATAANASPVVFADQRTNRARSDWQLASVRGESSWRYRSARNAVSSWGVVSFIGVDEELIRRFFFLLRTPPRIAPV